LFTRTKPTTLAVAAAGLLALALVGCTSGNPSSSSSSSQPSSTPRQGDTLTMSAGGDPLAIDPALIKSGLGTQISVVMAETLTTYKDSKDGSLQPLLATSWKPNSTNDVWTFKLRANVKFQDGTPFDADAVKANFDRLRDKSLAVLTAGDVATFVKSEDVVDPQTIAINLTQPVSYFPNAVSNQTSAITSPTSWTVAPNTYKSASKVVGTGPYKLTEWVQNDHITVTRNDDYWGKKPYYKTQIFKFIPDANARETALRAGQIDLAVGLPAADLDSMKNNTSLDVNISFGTRINYLAINTASTANPLLQDPRVRQALNYAVDKKAIVKSVLFGAGQVSTTPGINGPDNECTLPQYTYNPKKAKQLLQSAGASGMTVQLLSPNGRFLQDSQTAQAIAGYLTDVGLKVVGPQIADNATNQAIIAAPQPASNADPRDQLFIWSFGADFAHPSQSLTRIYQAGSGLNFSHYKNDQVTDLTLKAIAEPDKKKAADLYCQAEKLVWTDAPVIFLYTAGFVVVSNTKVQGLSIIPNSVYDSIYAYPAA
jgi:peptide/nickel transport system substrate-binding protein